MAITLTLEQQQVVKPSTYLVVHEITDVDGVTDPAIIANLKRAFLIYRSADIEGLVRVCTVNDYVSYQPWPLVDPVDLTKFVSEDLKDIPTDVDYSLVFNVTSLPAVVDAVDIWDTVHNRSPTPVAVFPCEITEDDGFSVLSGTGRFPSVAPNGAAIPFSLYKAGVPYEVDSEEVRGYGVPTRSATDTYFRDSVIYTYHGSATAAENSTRAVQAAVKALSADINRAGSGFDEEFLNAY